MSFRWFIYYCALFGAWAAFLGWLLGRALAPTGEILEAGCKGMFLGLAVALALGGLDGLWSLRSNQAGQLFFQALTCLLIGSLGGLLGGIIGQFFLGKTGLSLFLILGWALTGLLIGMSICSFEVLLRQVRRESLAGVRRKLINGMLGGAVGGLLGSILSIVLKALWSARFPGQPLDLLWSPSASGFVALGVCIGLLIGLAQVFFHDAWIKVEAGFRAGRELLLSKGETVIGRAEACDVGLFGDAGVDPRHASIIRQGDRLVLVDAGTKGGTFLNEQRITGPTPLRSGDLIRVGRSVLRYGERRREQHPDKR
jgi:hypothetical protein